MRERKVVQQIPLEKIKPSEVSLRSYFDPEKLEELAQSIKEQGVLQPVSVKPAGNGFELIHGERRFRASKIAGLTKIPALVHNISADQQIQQGLIENLQRENVDSLTEAQGLNHLHKQLSTPVSEIAQKIGKSDQYVRDRIRLLDLPTKTQELLLREMITPTHALQILRLKDPQDLPLVAAQTVKFKLTSEGTSALVDRLNYLYENPPKEPEVKEKVLQQPEIVFPCNSCKRKFAKHQLENYELCPECAGQIYQTVQKIRKEFQQKQTDKQALSNKQPKKTQETPS